jgi:DNA-binding transcriptional MerR regulator
VVEEAKEEAFERPLTLPQLARLAEVEYRTLHTWLRRGLIEPSVQRSAGAGTPNLFSRRNAITARVLADLRRLGLGFTALEQVALRLAEEPLPGADAVLVVNGRVAILSEKQELADALVRPEPAVIYRLAWAEVAIAGSEKQARRGF